MIGVKVQNQIARFGEGDILALTAQQYSTRASKLDVVKHDKKNDVYVVKVKDLVEFKIGEQIGVREVPKRLAEVLVPLAAPAEAAVV